MTGEPTTTATDLPALTTTGEIIATLRRTVARGEEQWFSALLSAIRQWPLPVERIGEREYRYLVGGEAFDWLLLAERLCSEIEGLVPDEEVEALLVHGVSPIDLTDDELQRLMGAKGGAHLNFYYGIRVEEALQLAVEAEVLKERFARVWDNGHLDDEVFQRVYGANHADLLARFCEERNIPDNGQMDLGTFNEFVYWLFKYRVNNSDPARTASDTRKGVAHLQALRAIARPDNKRPTSNL
jgi:hypothetical protein